MDEGVQQNQILFDISHCTWTKTMLNVLWNAPLSPLMWFWGYFAPADWCGTHWIIYWEGCGLVRTELKKIFFWGVRNEYMSLRYFIFYQCIWCNKKRYVLIWNWSQTAYLRPTKCTAHVTTTTPSSSPSSSSSPGSKYAPYLSAAVQHNKTRVHFYQSGWW